MTQNIMFGALLRSGLLKSHSKSIRPTSLTFGTSKLDFKEVLIVSRLCSCNLNTLSQDRPKYRNIARHNDLLDGNKQYLHNGMGLTHNQNVFKSIFMPRPRYRPRPSSFGSVLVQQSVRMFSIQSAVESVVQTQAEWFQSLSESAVVSYAQNFLLLVHDVTGLPWWGSIVLATITVRAMLAPLAVYHNYVIARRENVEREVLALEDEFRKEVALGIQMYDWSKKQAFTKYMAAKRRCRREFYIRDNCHPIKEQLLVLIQVPTWIIISTALRNLVYMMPESNTAAQLICLEMSVGGFGWIPNLTIPDASFIIPVTFGLVNLAVNELHSLSRVRQLGKFGKFMKNAIRVICVVMIPVAASVPSSLSLYWTTSSVFGLGQTLLFLSPRFKRAVGMPITADMVEQPYKHIAEKIAERAARLYKPLITK